MGERTGLLIGFLTVNQGFKSVRGGKYTLSRVEFKSKEYVFGWIGYFSYFVLLNAAVNLVRYPFLLVFFRSPLLMEVFPHCIVPPDPFPSSTCLSSNLVLKYPSY